MVRDLPAQPLADRLEWRWIAEGGPMQCRLALDSEAVYWADEWDGTVRRLPKAGGASVVIAERQGAPMALAVDDRHAFWTVAATERLRRVPKTGGAFGGLAAEVTVPAQIALDETDVFFTRHHVDAGEDDAIVVRVAKGGGPAAVVARAAIGEKSRSIALAGKDVYFALEGHMSGHGSVRRVAKSGGEVATLAADLLDPGSLAVDDGFVYFTTSGRAQDGQVVRVPRTGGAQVALYKAGSASPIALALDAGHVFFTDSSGAVWRLPKAGGEAHKLANLPDGAGTAAALAVDGSTLWVCGDHGLYKLTTTASPEPPQLLPTHGSAASALAFDGRGNLVGADYAGRARAYDVATGRSGPELGRGARQRIRNLAIAAGGQALLIVDHEGTIESWDLLSGTRQWQNTTEDPRAITTEAFALSPDGTLLLHRRQLQPIRLVAADSGKDLRTFKDRTEDIRAIAIAPDNSFWLDSPRHLRHRIPRPLPRGEPPLRMWDLASGRAIAMFSGDPESIRAIAISRDGKRAVSASEQGLLRVWDIASRKAITTLQTSGEIDDVALSRSGDRALTLSLAEGTCLWDLPAQKRLACAPARPNMSRMVLAPSRVIFSPSEDEAWWSSSYGYLRWKLPPSQ